MYRQRTATYSEVIEKLEKAMAWLDGMGIFTGTKRHATYLSTLRKIDREWRAQDAIRSSEGSVDAKQMATAFAEANQLIRIWQSFAGQEPVGLEAKLRTFSGGPVLEDEEKPGKSGNSARDIGLELEVAAFLKGVGQVELSQGVDVVLPFRGMTFFFECKRPSSEKMISENLDRASEQIERELGKTRLVGYGIPAISVAKAEWPGGVALGAPDIRHIRGSIQSWVTRVDRDYLGPWFKKRTDKRMAAVLVHIPYDADLPDSPPMPSVEFFIIAGCPEGTAAHADLLALKTCLPLPE